MGSRPTAKQWLAARQICEGAAPTTALMADALGVDDGSIYNRARREGWLKLDFRFPHVKAFQRDMIEAAAEAAGRGAPTDAQAAGSDAAGISGATAPDATVLKSGEAGDGPADESIEDAPDAVEMMGRASRFVSRQILALMDKADRRGGRLDKSQIDGLVSMSRMMERWEAIARERQVGERKKNDEDLAALLREIDTRIITLAQAEAERLCEEWRSGQAG
jgi:hypothetical protein